MSIKVTLRDKKISDGRKSLYLDYYPPIPNPKTGKPTRREFLKLYIYEKPKGSQEKEHNANTLEIAKGIQTRRHNNLNKPEIYTEFEKEQLRLQKVGDECFLEYFKSLINKRKASNKDNWFSAYKYLKEFTGGNIKFKDLNQTFFEDFKQHLLSTKSRKSSKSKLSHNSAASYFNKVKASLRQAYVDDKLKTDLNAKIKSIKPLETRREILTLEELNNLAQTHCNNPLLKSAALFSALTGLRWSDIKKMTWKELEYVEGQGYRNNFDQKKTKGVEYHPISDQAYELTEGTENPKDMPQDEKVFEGLKYSSYHNRHLFQWIGAAGITKHITFHCFRHTYATLQISQGTDIYTLSKLLGHKSIKHTQVYAKIMDEQKRKASNKIKIDL